MGAQSILNLFPADFREIFGTVARRQSRLQEIRLRAGKPIYVIEADRELFLDEQGNIMADVGQAKILSAADLAKIVSHICQYSLYAYEDELRQGFLTVASGHRVGIVGQAVLTEHEDIRTIKYISGLNIRIAHEIKGAADRVLPYIYCEGRLQNTIIISPPGCGKTTILRDLIRQVSDGNSFGKGISVGVVDERSEIAACFHGYPQNDVGIRTDVLDSCPKAKGMMMLIRSMSPKALAIDELGNTEEWKALLHASYCGIAVLATMHGTGLDDYKRHSEISLSGQNDIFRLCIVLRKRNDKCIVEKIYENEAEGEWRCRFQI